MCKIGFYHKLSRFCIYKIRIVQCLSISLDARARKRTFVFSLGIQIIIQGKKIGRDLLWKTMIPNKSVSEKNKIFSLLSVGFLLPIGFLFQD